MKDKIEQKYKINRGSLKAINKFKEFVGDEVFNQLLVGIQEVEIPFEESRYVELLSIVLEKPDEIDLIDVPYEDTEAILLFFCEPFIGRSLKQAKSILDTTCSILQKLDPDQIKTVMDSMPFPNKSGTDSDVSS